MGADLKRKEARKRMFGSQNRDFLFDANVQLDLEDTSGNEPPKKKSKQALPLPSSSGEIPTAGKNAVGKVAVVEESTDHGKEEKSGNQKAQRFIVFIGLSTLVNVLGSAV